MDCRNIKPNRPGKNKTETTNAEEQLFYFNIMSTDKTYNTFLANQINKSESENSLLFKIKTVAGRTKSGEKAEAKQDLDFSEISTPTPQVANNKTDKKLNQVTLNFVERLQRGSQQKSKM